MNTGTTTTTYALIERNSGFVWAIIEADSPESACHKASLETGCRDIEYEKDHGSAGDSGYLVYEAPDGFEVADGQDMGEIASVEKMPLVGRYMEMSRRWVEPSSEAA